MKITQGHVNLMLRCKGGSIGRIASGCIPKVDIDALINAQTKTVKRYEAQNVLAILRSARKRGALVEKLRSMSISPGTVINPVRRAAYCRKWLKRIAAHHKH
jgi:hypothetical protein